MHVLNYPLYALPKELLIFTYIGCISMCNSTPRPSCIEIRDWWHEDRGLHSLKANQKSAIFWSFVQYSGLNCKQRLIGASQWIFAQKRLEHASSTIWNRAEAVHRFACQLITFLVKFVN
ncbi:hypothetical protein CsSME_00051214 [Camellia sinensis var. sinensis]